MKNHLKSLLALALLVSFCSSCGDGNPAFEVPYTYNFQPASWTGQIQRRAMLSEMTSYMKSANTTGVTLDAAELKNMFANTGEPFADASLNSSGKQLENKCFELDRAMFLDYMDRIAAASTSTLPGSNGVAGVVSSGSKSYLCDENGIEYTQLIEKGLMGAVFYYQATDVYLGADRMSADNITVDAENGTDMEHHWDEAFGYLGVPTDFPSNTDGLAWWGTYVNRRNALLNTNEIMTEFIKGRAAISNNDLAARDEAIIGVQAKWELASAGTVVNYLNTALDNFNDDAIRNHALSEAAGFAYALKFNPNKKVTNANVDEILTKIGGSPVFKDMNFYNTTEDDLNDAKNLIAGYFNEIEAVKDEL